MGHDAAVGRRSRRNRACCCAPAKHRLPGRRHISHADESAPYPVADLGTTVPTRLIAAPEVNADLGAAVTAPAVLRKA